MTAPTMIKAHSLTGRIDLRLARQAFLTVKRHRGAAGVDRISIKMFAANLEANLLRLVHDLKHGTFQPRPSRRVYLPKDSRGTAFRPLGIPVVRDRVAQEILRRLLTPIFAPLFHQWSFGFIQGRNCHTAIEQVLQFHAAGYRQVVDADIKAFFDTIPHHVVMQAVAARVADGNILRLVERFLTAGVMENGAFTPTTIGTPQGGVISPLLANMVLNHLDWRLAAAGCRFVRYADDFVVACANKRSAQEALTLVRVVVEDELGLHLSPEKTVITSYGKGYDFLGFRLSPRSRRMRSKSLERFQDKVRSLTVRHHNLDATAIEYLNQVIRGTARYFSAPFSTCRWQFQKLDSWIRMRLRCMKWKRKSTADNRRLRVKKLRTDLGLLSLEEVWLACHGLAGHAVPRHYGALSVGVARCGKAARR